MATWSAWEAHFAGLSLERLRTLDKGMGTVLNDKMIMKEFGENVLLAQVRVFIKHAIKMKTGGYK